jgi:hypothetical protein
MTMDRMRARRRLRRLRDQLVAPVLPSSSGGSGGISDVGDLGVAASEEHLLEHSWWTGESAVRASAPDHRLLRRPCRAVPRVRGEDLAPADFCSQYVDRGRPVLLAGAAAEWPALRTWSVEHLAQRVGDRTVDVALGVEESSEPTVKASVGLVDLARQISASETQAPDGVPSSSSSSGGAGGELGLFRGPVYLKQTDLFRLDPSLKDDLDMGGLLGNRCLCSSTHYCWVGPRGAVTGLHNDDEDNLLAQLCGRKRVLIYEPAERPNLYVNSKYDSGTECCDACPVAPDLARHPLLRNARPPLAVTLEPGDALFLPKFWFHHVTSLSTTISVNLFFSTPRDFLQHGLVRTGKEVLHAVGLLGRGNCVCHPASAG